jgi:hypothetical protein
VIEGSFAVQGPFVLEKEAHALIVPTAMNDSHIANRHFGSSALTKGSLDKGAARNASTRVASFPSERFGIGQAVDIFAQSTIKSRKEVKKNVFDQLGAASAFTRFSEKRR